jgi:hypothetical protein
MARSEAWGTEMLRKFLAIAAVMASASSAHSAAATLIPVVPVPGSTATYVEDINDDNIIVGAYTTANGNYHGFFGTLDGQYTTFDYGTTETFPTAINNAGYIVGFINPTDVNFIAGMPFERTPSGTFKTVTKDGAIFDGRGRGINDRDKFVGEIWNDDTGIATGFLGKSGRYKQDVPLSVQSNAVHPFDINNSGDVVGYFLSNGHAAQGFLNHSGVTSMIVFPDASQNYTQALGWAGKNVITGFWHDTNGNTHGFELNLKFARYESIDVPGSQNATMVRGNSAGLVALQSDLGGFIYCPKKPSQCPGGGMEIRASRAISAPAGAFLNPGGK